MRLIQKQAAERLGVNVWTLLNWENGRTDPPVVAMPAVIKFLDYDPFPPPETLPERLLAKRREMGWSIKEAAEFVGVDPGTWANWKHGRIVLYRRHCVLVAEIIKLSIDGLDQTMTARWSRLHKGDL